ncbi:MAG TPA: hypothetical protein VFG93_01110 [Gaiellaceae bacterium]|nr:hypothetical protein [Gaiellaceae bacterium]
MKLALVSFFVALVAAPLAAQAAQSPARFALTLNATVVDHFTYSLVRVSEDCSIRRTGFGGRELRLRSPRATEIQVTRGPTGLVYRPGRVLARVTGVAPIGSFGEVKRCRAEPILKGSGDCKARTLEPRRLRVGFHSGRGMLAFQKPAVPGDVQLCGLDQTYQGGWLQLAPGRVDANALLNGTALRVVAYGSAKREATVVSTPTLRVAQRTTVRWTLAFRRLS